MYMNKYVRTYVYVLQWLISVLMDGRYGHEESSTK